MDATKRMGAWRCHSIGGSGSSAIDRGQATRRGDEEMKVGGAWVSDMDEWSQDWRLDQRGPKRKSVDAAKPDVAQWRMHDDGANSNF